MEVRCRPAGGSRFGRVAADREAGALRTRLLPGETVVVAPLAGRSFRREADLGLEGVPEGVEHAARPDVALHVIGGVETVDTDLAVARGGVDELVVAQVDPHVGREA